MKIRIAIIDDHPMVRKGLQSMLRLHKNIEVIAQYGNGRNLLDGLQTQQPDVLLLDLQLPDIGGEALMPVLKEKYPNIRVIILTANNNLYNIKMLLNSGASGYLLKNTEQELLVQAIETVYGGHVFLSPEVKSALSKATLKTKNKMAVNEDLTPRELDILRLIAKEKTSHEIGAALYLSYRTVENYRIGIMQKLGVKNMVGMVKKAIILGII